MNKGIYRKRKLKNGRFFWVGADKKYASILCQKDKIIIECTDVPATICGAYIVPIHIDQTIMIPASIRRAYRLGREITCFEVELSRKFIIQAKTDIIPLPLIGWKVKDTMIEQDKNALYQYTAVLTNSYRLSIGNLLPEEWKYRKITVCIGDSLRMRVSNATNEDLRKLPTLAELKDDYGQNLQELVAESFSYIVPIKSRIGYNTITFPKIFLETADVREGSNIKCFLLTDEENRETYIFAPEENKECFIEEKPILPLEDKPEKVTICKECEEEASEIRLLLKEVSELKEMLNIIAAKANSTK